MVNYVHEKKICPEFINLVEDIIRLVFVFKDIKVDYCTRVCNRKVDRVFSLLKKEKEKEKRKGKLVGSSIVTHF